MAQARLTVAERFWPKVDIRGDDECWPWLASRDTAGYGRLGRPGHQGEGKSPFFAHRISYSFAHDVDPEELPGSLIVRHTCDNPPCCNPRHLLPGTKADNHADSVERNRAWSQLAERSDRGTFLARVQA